MNKVKQLQVRLLPQDGDRLWKYCEKIRIPAATLARKVLLEYLDEAEKLPPVEGK